MTSPHTLSAEAAIWKIREGSLSSVELVRSCLARIEDTDGQIKAWKWLEPERAIAEARALDSIRQSGRPLGMLHGVPVGLKDIIDTRDYPTENGSPIFAGRKPEADARLADHLRNAGAVILGKTVTTEFAYMHPAETRNPHDLAHIPGGSSSGSAAAVAAFQVPLAIGTQTNGSVIRPASFCGTYALKPSRGVISRQGVLQTSKSLDQIGAFGRKLEDVALLCDAIAGYDPTDTASYGRPRPQMLNGCKAQPATDPVLAWFDLPFNDRLDNDARARLLGFVGALGGHVEKLPAPDSFASHVNVQRTIHEYEFCHHMEQVLEQHWESVSDTLKPIVERGRTISDEQYQNALGAMDLAVGEFESIYEKFDAIIAPSATGEAPKFGKGTGDPIFCTIWNLCGLPALNLPLLTGKNGLPIGVQLIGGPEDDARLLRTANWILGQLQAG